MFKHVALNVVCYAGINAPGLAGHDVYPEAPLAIHNLPALRRIVMTSEARHLLFSTPGKQQIPRCARDDNSILLRRLSIQVTARVKARPFKSRSFVGLKASS
jgi:hypothetical protein